MRTPLALPAEVWPFLGPDPPLQHLPSPAHCPLLSASSKRKGSHPAGRAHPLPPCWDLGSGREGAASQGSTARLGAQCSEFLLPKGRPHLSHTPGSACTWWLSGQERDLRCCPGAAHLPCLTRPMNRLPYVTLQVKGRSQPGDPGHHCFLQSESEAGGVSWRVSAPAQPSPDPRGWAVKSLMATPTTPFCLLAGSCLVPLPSPPPFSLSCFRGFQPLSFPPLFLPSPFSSSFSFTSSSSSLSLVWAHGRWRELPKSLCHGVSKGALCPSSHIRAQHPPYPHLCTG